MREVLFKAKRLDNGDWIDGFYVSSENKHYIVKSMTDLGMTFSFVDVQEIDPNTLSQFTGSIDVNGNKIFEKDILKTKLIDQIYYEIVYWCRFNQGWLVARYLEDETEYIMYFNQDRRNYAVRMCSQEMITNSNTFVCGNIHDTERTQ